MRSEVFHGDCREVMAGMEAASVDAIVTDPPYGLSFMGKGWDKGVPGEEFWREALRVAKPGAHLVAFGGTRKFHRLAVAIEDAGWEIRDTLAWMYGQGFPKSLDVSKAVDAFEKPLPGYDALKFTAWFRTAGVSRRQVREATQSFMDSHYLTSGSQPVIPTPEHWALLRPLVKVDIPEWVDQMIRDRGKSENLARREVIGTALGKDGSNGDVYAPGVGKYLPKEYAVTLPFTDIAKHWSGWGTALKPAWEPIILARKPIVGTVARNVLAHGTGAINVDGCRIGWAGPEDAAAAAAAVGYSKSMKAGRTAAPTSLPTNYEKPAYEPDKMTGRWPANVVLDKEAARALDEQSGNSRAGAPRADRGAGGIWSPSTGTPAGPQYGDSGGASRFFYTSKASRSDRGEGNRHPTVKPVDLMRWLVRLVTPRGGLVLDPFCGSGSTLVAAFCEGLDAAGIELDEESVETSRRRVREEGPIFAAEAEEERALREAEAREEAEVEEREEAQLDLLGEVAGG